MADMTTIVWGVALGYWDIRYRRLPNVLTFGAALAGLGSWLITGASPLGASALSMLAGAGVALLLTVPGYLLRQLGAGDVKLLVAIALLGGASMTLASFVAGSLLAGAVVVAWIFLGPRFGLPPLAGRRLPFGACLAAGLVAALLSGQVSDPPWLR